MIDTGVQQISLGGPSSRPSRLGHWMADSRACGHFERGAACYAAAARAFSTSYAATAPGARFPRLLHCGDAAVNQGATLTAMAVANGSCTQPPG